MKLKKLDDRVRIFSNSAKNFFISIINSRISNSNFTPVSDFMPNAVFQSATTLLRSSDPQDSRNTTCLYSCNLLSKISHRRIRSSNVTGAVETIFSDYGKRLLGLLTIREHSHTTSAIGHQPLTSLWLYA